MARGTLTSRFEVVVLGLGLAFVGHSNGDSFQRVAGWRRRVLRSRTRVRKTGARGGGGGGEEGSGVRGHVLLAGGRGEAQAPSQPL